MFVTNSSGLFHYDGVATTPFTADFSPLLVSEQIFCAATNGKYVAFGTVRKGVVMKNLTNGVTSYANVFTGLQNNTVLSMTFDRTGNLWLGLDNGVSYMMTEMPYSSLLDVRNSNGTGYASQVYGDKLYLGTNQGLFFTAYPPQYSYIIAAGVLWVLYKVLLKKTRRKMNKIREEQKRKMEEQRIRFEMEDATT